MRLEIKCWNSKNCTKVNKKYLKVHDEDHENEPEESSVTFYTNQNNFFV